MRKAIANTIASLLDAIPYQVELWDGEVIDHLVHNSELLSDFDEGGSDAKWSIYHSIKYGHLL